MADSCAGCHADIGAEIAARTGLHGRLGATLSGACSGCHPEHDGRAGALTVLDEASFPHDLTGYSLRSHKKTAKAGRFVCADCHPRDVTDFDQAVCAEVPHGDRRSSSWEDARGHVYGKDCLPCHDGSGRDGAAFDHGAVPFKLTGKHVGVPCADCHTEARSGQGIRNTPQDCYSCHAADDEHDGAYGRQCEGCHTAAHWSDVTLDHAVFPLDHGSEELKATCQTCHPVDLKTYTCYGCHAHTEAKVRGQHEGQSPGKLADCVRCHAGGQQGGD